MERITARDGAGVVLHSTGTGPGIVVVHGGGVTIDIYRRFAERLAGRFTVHLYNRRGRADAAPRAVPYTHVEDVDDLDVVMEHTGAVNVLGHSGGGFVALQAALKLPIERLALYDAAVSVDHCFPSQWLESARKAARAGDIPRAIAITGAGLNPQMLGSKLPLAVQVPLMRAFLRTPIGRMMGELLPGTLDEAAHILANDGPASRWAGVEAQVLLACGADGPPVYPVMNEMMAAALPHARTLTIPRSGHDAVNRAPARLIEPLAAFFATPVPSQR
jgi:pimeloyl-ACP methyl ester carboxylesterase